jgi:hypothetical protein
MTPSAGTLAGDRRVGAYTKYRLYPPGTIGTKNPGMMNSVDHPGDLDERRKVQWH